MSKEKTTKTAFLAWRERMKISQRTAAAKLGVTLTTYQSWEREARFRDGKPLSPPISVLLAAAALEHGLSPIEALAGEVKDASPFCNASSNADA